MKILVADNIAQSGIDTLESKNHTVYDEPELEGADLIDALSNRKPQILVVRSTRVTAEALEASPNLGLIVRAGAGYDTIDVQGAADRGIYVANCPGQNSVAVAELTIGCIIALDRRIPDNVIEARNGHWNKKEFSQADGLKGKCLGVIGTGNIGKAVISRAKALDLDVIAWSRSLTPEKADEMEIGHRETPKAVAGDADIVSIHVASKPETHDLADRSFFEAMNTGAYFINTSRSEIVDEDALEWALEEKNLRAAIDVMEGEPEQKETDFKHPLADHPNLYMTHHIGASTQQAQDATAEEAARVIITFDETGTVPNCVNLAEQSTATFQMSVRHEDKVGVLASVLDEMRGAGWNIQEMENRIFQGERAATASIRFNGERDEAVVERIRSVDEVFAVSLVDLS